MNNHLTGGSFMIVGFQGTEPDAQITEMICQHQVAGIILFSRNITSPQQLARLTNQLQALAHTAGYQAPLLICLDQENGVIRRINQGATLLPGAMALAATGHAANAQASYAASAAELVQLGINWNLAPDSDVNNNPLNPVIGVRSFSDQATTVSHYVQAAVHGMQQHQLASCLKHFPGHGDTSVDSHQGLPIIQKSLAELTQVELAPFKAGIQAQAASIMVAHILFPALDAKLPASLSAVMLTDLLREQLAYQGLIVTDDLEMGAISNQFGTDQACLLALQNGADLVMVSHEYQAQKAALKLINQALATNQLDTKKMQRSAQRIYQARQQYGRWDNHFNPKHFAQTVGEHQVLARQLYQKSLTIRQQNECFAADQPVIVVVWPTTKLTQAVDYQAATDPLVQVSQQYFSQVTVLTGNTLDQISTILDQHIDQHSHVIMGTTNISSPHDPQVAIVQQLLQRTSHLAIIAQRNPYDFCWLPATISIQMATYENTPTALAAAVRQLSRHDQSQGKLPVRLPNV